MANIELDGANKTLKVDSGDLTLDIPGDIVLDADGGDVFVKDAGTTFGSLTNTSGNLIIKSGTTTAATFSGANVTLAGTVASGAITSSGIIKTDDATDATSTTDGSLQTDGGLSVVKDTVMGDDLKLLSDASVIHFGANSEITLTHSHDAGLNLKHTATADDKPVVLTLQTGETDIAQDDVIGALNFQAPDEGTGTDAILVAAGIEAVSEGDFSSSNNATKLSFKTAASEAAAEKASLSSTGVFTATSFAGSGAGLTAGTTPLTTLDIDGGTDIGADIVDADLFVIDDGAGGTNRKTAASRLKTYIGGGNLVRVGGSNSSSATGTVILDDIFTADYMFYKVFGRMEPSVDNYLPQMRLRTGGSSGSDESGTNYKFTLKTSRKGNNTDDNNDGSASGNAFSIGRYGTDAETENGGYFEMTVCNPYGTGTLSGTGAGSYCHVFSHYTHKGSSDNAVQTMMGGRYDGALTATGMKFQFTSNNVEEHNIQVFGVKNS